MQISKKHRMVILDKQDAGLLRAAIPELIELQDAVAIPHTVKNTRILNSMGKSVPSPIMFYYNFPNSQGYSPYQAQSETAAFLTMNPNGFCLNSLGTGKTLSSLWAWDFLKSQDVIKKTLVISPLSTLNRVWGDALWMNFQHRSFEILHGPKQKRLEKLDKDVDVYIINPDGTKVMYEALMERDDINHIIVDEIAEYRSAKTDKFKVLQALVNQGKSIWGLTGTPTPNSPTDAWSQCRLVCPDNVPKYFNRFRQEVMFQISQFKWLPKDNALDKVYAAMQPSIRFTRDDCLDLPDATFIDLEAELSKEQLATYKDMSKSLYAEFEKGEISAANEAVKMSKLIQIAGGVVYGSDGQPIHLDCKKRLDTVCDVVRQAGQKVIVFVPFTEMTKMVSAAIKKEWSVAIVDGSVSSKARDQIFTDFQTREDPHVLVAHPKCMSHGLTLTAASTIIWYAAYANTADYMQANGRIRRGGQKHNQLYVHISGTEIERRVYEKIRNNESVQNVLLNMLTKRS